MKSTTRAAGQAETKRRRQRATPAIETPIFDLFGGGAEDGSPPELASSKTGTPAGAKAPDVEAAPPPTVGTGPQVQRASDLVAEVLSLTAQLEKVVLRLADVAPLDGYEQAMIIGQKFTDIMISVKISKPPLEENISA